ncbi:tyrosinase-like [Mustelus asterias]
MARASRVAWLLLYLGAARAQIPLPCADRAHVEAGECCPAFWGDGSPCGSASGRGRCREVGGLGGRGERADFRLGWPGYFFRWLCWCAGNYGGADCGECGFGWRGEGCRERHLAVRRELANLTAGERRRFVRNLQASKVTLSKRYAVYASEASAPNSRRSFRRESAFNVATWVHHLTSKTLDEDGRPFYAHRSTAFPVWHRLFLLFLESEIRNVTADDSFFIPVWTWAGKGGCDVCTRDLFGSSGSDGHLKDSIFRSWQTFCADDDASDFGMDVICPPASGSPILRYNTADPDFGGLPSLADMQACLGMEAFDSAPYGRTSLHAFRNALEGNINPQNPDQITAAMHNLVHIFCGGTLGSVLHSSNDPLFPSLHAYVDKLFEQWLRMNPKSTYPEGQIPQGHRARDRIVPFLPLWENQDFFHSCREFGYDYVYEE